MQHYIQLTNSELAELIGEHIHSNVTVRSWSLSSLTDSHMKKSQRYEMSPRYVPVACQKTDERAVKNNLKLAWKLTENTLQKPRK